MVILHAIYRSHTFLFQSYDFRTSSFSFSGGFNGEKPFNTCEMYDPKYGKWVDLPSMQEPRLSFGCCVLNEQIYAIGGSNGSNIKSCEKFDPSLNKWISIAAMATARYFISLLVFRSNFLQQHFSHHSMYPTPVFDPNLYGKLLRHPYTLFLYSYFL